MIVSKWWQHFIFESTTPLSSTWACIFWSIKGVRRLLKCILFDLVSSLFVQQSVWWKCVTVRNKYYRCEVNRKSKYLNASIVLSTLNWRMLHQHSVINCSCYLWRGVKVMFIPPYTFAIVAVACTVTCAIQHSIASVKDEACVS